MPTQRSQVFFGHPGIPLSIVLYLEQVALYAIGRLAGSPAGFTAFTAQHALDVWLLAKLSMVVLSIVSFVALYQFALILLRRSDLALWSVGLYATCFPVLYYLNRVSVEPLMNAFFLWTMVCIAKADEQSARMPALRWAALAGVCAVSAFFTKLHLMAALPLFGLAGLLAGTGLASPRSARRRAAMAVGYLLAAIVSGVLFSWFMDWDRFTRAWGSYGEHAPSLSARSWEMTTRIATALSGSLAWMKGRWLPACTKSNCFFLFEFAFLLAALLGAVVLLRRRGGRRFLVLVLTYCCFVACIWLYRATGRDFHGFHYLLPVMAAAAPMVVVGISHLAPGVLDTTRPLRRRCLEMGVITLVLHYTGFFAVVDSKGRDREAFVTSGAPLYFAALRKAGPSRRIVVIGGAAGAHGLSDDSYTAPGQRAVLMLALEDKVLSRDKPPEQPRAFAGRARRLGVDFVLDFTMTQPGPWTLDEWLARAAR